MLSVVVIAKNEEERIKVCLQSVKWADEVIVLDNGSVDKTAELAKEMRARVIRFVSDNFAQIRNKAFEETKGDWVLYVDADERVTKDLQEEVKLIMAANNFSAYAISRKNIIFGEEVSYGPYKKDWVIRLLKRKDFKEWIGEVHEYPKFEGKLGYAINPLIHLTHRDLDHFILKSLEWSKIDANLRIKSNHPKMSEWRFIRILITEFYVQLIKRKGLFGGTVGIVDSVLQVFSFYMSYVRLWEYQKGKTSEEIYKEIDKKLVEQNFKYSK